MAKIRKITPAAKVMEVGSKTSSNGFAAGGAPRKSGGRIDDEQVEKTSNFSKRARGGAAFSSAGNTSGRSGSSSSGHEGE